VTFSDFFDNLSELDWVGVLVATAAVTVLAAVWYGPLFGKAWSAAVDQPYSPGMPNVGKVVQTVIYFLVLNIGLAYTFILDDVEHALVFGGIVIGVLIIGPWLYGLTVWEGRKMRAFLIDLLFVFLAVSVAIYVQGVMA
jgi:hypothetical protein